MSSEIAGVLAGMGVLVLLSVVSYAIYHVTRGAKFEGDFENKYYILKELTLEKLSENRGIDLRKEVIKRDLIRKKSFRKKVEEEMVNELFGKEKEEEKK